MPLTEAIEEIKAEMASRFASGNSVPVERAIIRREEWSEVLLALEANSYVIHQEALRLLHLDWVADKIAARAVDRVRQFLARGDD